MLSLKKDLRLAWMKKGLTGGYIVSKYGAWNNVEAIQIELRYTTYIENRMFGEEEVAAKNDELFKETQLRLVKVFQKIKTLFLEKPIFAIQLTGTIVQ